jgi:hypothetical protein
VIEAIRKLRWLQGYGARVLGNIYLLGTPIYTLPRPRLSRGRAVLYAASVIAMIATLLLHDLTFIPSLIGIVARAPVLYWLQGRHGVTSCNPTNCAPKGSRSPAP